MSLEDRIFLNFKDAVETFLRMGFRFTDSKRLVRNDLEVVIRSTGTDIWRSSVERLECKQVQNKPLNLVPADNVKEESIRKAESSCEKQMNAHTDTKQNES